MHHALSKRKIVFCFLRVELGSVLWWVAGVEAGAVAFFVFCVELVSVLWAVAGVEAGAGAAADKRAGACGEF